MLAVVSRAPDGSEPFLGGSFDAADPDMFQYTNDGFFDGEADVPTAWVVANGYYMHDHRDEVRALYGLPAGDPALIEAFDVQERTVSAYVQTDMEFGEKFQAQAGLRFVSVDTHMAVHRRDHRRRPRPPTRASTNCCRR